MEFYQNPRYFLALVFFCSIFYSKNSAPKEFLMATAFFRIDFLSALELHFITTPLQYCYFYKNTARTGCGRYYCAFKVAVRLFSRKASAAWGGVLFGSVEAYAGWLLT